MDGIDFAWYECLSLLSQELLIWLSVVGDTRKGNES